MLEKPEMEQILHDYPHLEAGDKDMEYALAERNAWIYTGKESIRGELVRKFLHISIALTPFLAEINFTGTVILLSFGVLAYSVFEFLRCMGLKVFLVSELTLLASRRRDHGRFVLGPITLGIGAVLALLLFSGPVATIAIYALAFGDGLASLAGKAFGRISFPGVSGKTVEGSLTCFLAVFFSSQAVTVYWPHNLAIALFATFLEFLPLKDMDNIVIPVGTGTLTSILFFLA